MRSGDAFGKLVGKASFETYLVSAGVRQRSLVG